MTAPRRAWDVILTALALALLAPLFFGIARMVGRVLFGVEAGE